MKKMYALLLFIGLLATSCTSLRVVRLEPAEPASIDRYLYGAAIQKQATTAATVEVGYSDADRRHLVFDINITNTGETSFDFDPATVQLFPSNGAPAIQAIDPELQILSLDIKSSSRERNARIFSIAAAAATTAALLIDAAPAAGDNLFALDQGFVLDVATQVPYILIDLSSPRAPSDALHEVGSRGFWKDVAMRITTLRPGETALGKLVFPRSDKAPVLDLAVTINGQTMLFPFQQRIVWR